MSMRPQVLSSVCVLACLPGSAFAQGRVDVLIVCDTDTKLAGIERDARAMRAVFEAGIQDPRLLRITNFTGPMVSPQQVFDYYRKVQVGPNDALVFFYTGHGATDPRRGHCLTTERGMIYRDDLRKAMQARGTRLNVLLTDCCSNVVDLPPAMQAPTAAPPTLPEFVRPLLRQLFLEHRGTVDITAAELGQSAWATNLLGGFFANALSEHLFSFDVKGHDVNGDGFVTWAEFFAPIRDQTQFTYRSFRRSVLDDDAAKYSGRVVAALQKQEEQVPHAFSLGERGPAVATDYFVPNLNAYVSFEPLGQRYGLKLTRPPLSGSPLLPRQLEPGDMIIEMDGLPLRHPVDVLSHVGATPSVFINTRNDQKTPMQLQLPNQVYNAEWAPVESLTRGLGIYYRLVPMGQGAYGARLSRQPIANSPVTVLRLEIGDMIVSLDETTIHGPDDVVNHVGKTSLRFINIRTGEAQSGEITLPAQVVR
jgi:hypothetical protein